MFSLVNSVYWKLLNLQRVALPLLFYSEGVVGRGSFEDVVQVWCGVVWCGKAVVLLPVCWWRERERSSGEVSTARTRLRRRWSKDRNK